MPRSLALPLLVSVVVATACGSKDEESPVTTMDGNAPDAGAPSSASSSPEGGVREVDHPAPTCNDVRTHLRGLVDGTDVEMHLCDFRYALVDNSPWANWTTFDDGLLFLSGPEDIFKAKQPIVTANAGLLRMPSGTKAAGRVYCGLDEGSYYEARDDSPPDAELKLRLGGYAGACGGTGDGTVDLSVSLSGAPTAHIEVGGTSRTRKVAGALGSDESLVFLVDGGIVDVRVDPPLPSDASGESRVTSATIGLREGDKQLMIACGAISGSVARTHTDKGDEYQLKLTGVPPWLDCAHATPVEGAITLTHDPQKPATTSK